MKFGNSHSTKKINSQLQQNPVAIIGMACIFPQAKNLQEYWKNILDKIDCITDVPPSRWNIEDYYDADQNAPDKTYCKRGGFLPDIDFNPLEFGLIPKILEVTDVSQMLSLVIAKEAMADAGYNEYRNFDRERTGVILGVGGGQKLITPLTSRLQYPIWKKVLKSSGLSDEDTENIIEKIKLAYINWTENSFPGMLGNVIAGRIANRLNLGGINCVVDAACASSLSALKMALNELSDNRSDIMLTGGVDTDNSPFMYMCFSKTPAFSKQENARPFDADSDGMLLGEGIGMMVLKRLEDAQRDGDRIYAVIKGIGTSSDGRYKSIYAPRSSGQALALRRAYEDAGFTPSSVGLIEAHGTGTMAGDPAEFAGLKEVFGENNPKKQYIALGSVKSQIGHTKSCAGAASLIKAALALHHKILPPTINITKPHPQLQIENSPFYLNTQTRPWMQQGEVPRLAGVSSFGFGGTNYHVVLAEYSSEHNQPYRLHHNRRQILLFASTQGQLLARCKTLLQQLHSDAKERHYAELVTECQYEEIPTDSARVGFVAESVAEVCEFLQTAIHLLTNNPTVESWEHPQGIYYRRVGIIQTKVVALFSGQGSQYLEMGKELTFNFPPLRQAYGYVDSLFLQEGLSPISDVVFPPPVFEKNELDAQVDALQRTENAQPSLGAFSVGLYKILQQAGFKPDFVAGHSFGELTALWAAGVVDDRDYYYLVKARGQAMASRQDPDFDAGAMLAVTGDISKVQKLIAAHPQIAIANWNSHNQVVLAGTKSEIARVQQVLNQQEYALVLLPVSAAFHTPLVNYAQKPFAQAIRNVTFRFPKIPVFSNITGTRYPSAPEQIRQTLENHILSPVLFKQEIENIYAAGGYCFVEFGPKSILTNLVKNILGDKPHLAIALNPHQRPSRDHSQIQTLDSDRLFRQAVVHLRVAGLRLGELDPYQLEPKAPAPQTNKGLTVRLNGSNYVSEKTKAAFEKALQDGHQVKSVKSTIPKPLKSMPTEPLPPTLSQQPSVPTEPLPPTLSQQPSVASSTKLEKPPVPRSSLNNQPILDSFERLMMRFYEHQAEVLRVHEQYLKNQAESTQGFFQLMQQQYSGLSTGNAIEPIASDNGSQPMQAALGGHREQGAGSREQGAEELLSRGAIQQEMFSSPLPPVPSAPLPHHPITPTLREAEESASTPHHPITPSPHHPLTQSLLAVVSDKTGYPAEMLELEMDMEADLGIDSIKRVEILGAMQELFPDLPPVNPEALAELRTLGQIVEYMSQQSSEVKKNLK